MSIEKIFKSMSWNKKLEVLRIAKGWSQEQAADKCGTSKKNYWLWEAGKNYPRNDNRRFIGIAFEVSEEDIFGCK